MEEDCESGDCLSIDPLTERVLGEVQTGKMCSFCGQSWRSCAQVMVQEIANLHCILGCFRFSLRNIAVLVEFYFTFPLSIQANHRVVSEIAVWPLQTWPTCHAQSCYHLMVKDWGPGSRLSRVKLP